MVWNRININRSVFDRKEFQLTVGPSGPSVFRKEGLMRYYYEKSELYSTIYGYTYRYNRPVYNECTLFKVNKKGLAIIQQRFDPTNKLTYWASIDPWLADELHLHKNFSSFFNDRSGPPTDGIYPTVTIRQIMLGLKMKPIKRERWETCFDRRLI